MDKVLQTLGLAYRAKKLVLGEDVLEMMNKVKLIIIASDISEKSRERVLKKCSYYNVEYIDLYTCGQISSVLGKNNIRVVGIIDEGFKKSLLNK